MKRVRLQPNFADIIARYGIGMNEMAELARLGRATIYALQNPDTHPHRRGGMHRTTAWKIANAFAEKTGVAPETAWSMLMVEFDEPRAPRTKKTE